MFAVLISIVLQHVGMHEHINFNTLYGSALDLVLIEDLKFHVHNPLEPPPHHRQKLIIRSKFMDIFLSLGSLYIDGHAHLVVTLKNQSIASSWTCCLSATNLY